MGTELQHWLSRNRPPRVQITYDVETLGATVKQEIPFIVGIISDLAGGERPDTPMSDREFVEIDRDNFNTVMEKRVAPTLTLPGPQDETLYLYHVARTPAGNLYAADSTQTFAAVLSFKTLDDFAPPSLIQQVPALTALLQTRQNLSALVAKLGTDPSLEATLWTKLPTALTAATVDLVASAVTSLKTANDKLGTSTTGATKDFNAAVAAVNTANPKDPEKSWIQNAVQAVTTAVGDATSGYTQAFATATAASAKPADVKGAGNQAWFVATAMYDAMKLFDRLVAPLAKTDPARTALSTAWTSVNVFIAAAGEASLSGDSAVEATAKMPAAS